MRALCARGLEGDVTMRFSPRRTVTAICASALAPVGSCAHAATIADTGEGDEASEGWTFNGTQWLAARIRLDQACSITDIAAWLWRSDGSEPGSDTVSVVIYVDGGDPQDAATRLYERVFHVKAPHAVAMWLGPHDPSWDLCPGNYWIPLETPSHGMAILATECPVPLHACPRCYVAALRRMVPMGAVARLGVARLRHPQRGCEPRPVTMSALGLGVLPAVPLGLDGLPLASRHVCGHVST